MKKRRASARRFFQSGGGEETRTPDPLHAKQVLYQLSYTPTGRRRLYAGNRSAVKGSGRPSVLSAGVMRGEETVPTGQPAVVVDQVVVRYERVVALDGVSLTVNTGAALGIVGPNGTGKSTLLKTVAGLVTPASGTVRIFGVAPESLPAGSIVGPGLIDVHTNGADECLFNRDQGNAVEVAARAYARMGATGFVASVMTAPWESMLHAASEISEAANQLEESADPIGARCLGIQFEGPFLNPKFRRVHRAEWN